MFKASPLHVVLQLNILIMYSCQHRCTLEEFIIKGILPVGASNTKKRLLFIMFPNLVMSKLQLMNVKEIHSAFQSFFEWHGKKKKKDILDKQWDLFQLHFNLKISAIYIALRNQGLDWFWNVHLYVYSDSWETDLLLKINTSYSILPS